MRPQGASFARVLAFSPLKHAQFRSLTPWLASFLAVFSLQRTARAGNDDGVLIGSQAALTGGAVTAITSDGSAAWYNPAGLAQIDRQALDINASVYGMNRYSADNLFTLPDGTNAGASVVDWVLVPSALSYTREINKRLVGSFGVFIPHTTDLDLRTSVSDADGKQWVFGVDQVSNEYNYILSFGIRVTDKLRLGVSIYGIYTSQENMTQVGLGTMGDPSAPFLNSSIHSTRGDYGARIGLGLQWDPTPLLKVGFAVQTPTLTAFRSISEYSLGSLFSPDATGFSFEKKDGLKSVWELSAPLLMRAGIAVSIEKVQLMLDGSVVSQLNSSEDDLDRKWAGNARIATMWQASERITGSLGLFTDFNGARPVNPDFVGIAGGVRLTTDHKLADGQRLLTFITTLGARYAYGFGHTEGLRFEDDGSELSVASQRVSIHAHEVALNLGGGVTF
jgi:hypothetical protein